MVVLFVFKEKQFFHVFVQCSRLVPVFDFVKGIFMVLINLFLKGFLFWVLNKSKK